MNKSQMTIATWVKRSLASMAVMAFFLGGFGLTQALAQSHGATPTSSDATVVESTSSGKGFALVGAGVAFGLAALGAGLAVASVGAAALGVLSEKPQMFGQAMMFVGLGEGIAILGFAMAFMIMQRAG
jgi:V/A-type H+-transporting ATPase subunit K